MIFFAFNTLQMIITAIIDPTVTPLYSFYMILVLKIRWRLCWWHPRSCHQQISSPTSVTNFLYHLNDSYDNFHFSIFPSEFIFNFLCCRFKFFCIIKQISCTFIKLVQLSITFQNLTVNFSIKNCVDICHAHDKNKNHKSRFYRI